MGKPAKLELRRVESWKGITRCAAALGISRSHLNRVMTGEREPGKELAVKMRKLGITPGTPKQAAG